MRVVLIFMSFLALGYGSLEAVEYTTAHPLSTVITTPVKECGKFTQLPVPMLAWVGDMPIIYANGNTETTSSGSIFAKKNLSVKLYRQDSLVSQVEDYLSCKTPFLRLTNGMAVMAMDVLNADAHTKPRPFYLYTWSEGGDVLVGRGSIKEPKDICNTDGSLQVYSPHVEYLATIARLAGCRIPVEKIHWVKDMIEEKVKRFYGYEGFINKKSFLERPIEKQHSDLRIYAQIIFQDGTTEEKLAILKNLKGKLLLKDKKVYVDPLCVWP